MVRTMRCVAVTTILVLGSTAMANMLPGRPPVKPPQPPTSQPDTQPKIRTENTRPGTVLTTLALGLGISGLLVGGGVWLARSRR
jgi:hypothetical protein